MGQITMKANGKINGDAVQCNQLNGQKLERQGLSVLFEITAEMINKTLISPVVRTSAEINSTEAYDIQKRTAKSSLWVSRMSRINC